MRERCNRKTQYWGVKILIGCEEIRNSGCGLAKHIRYDGIHRHVADGKRIWEAVFLATFHGYELIAVAGKLPQNTDILGLDKTAFHQANTDQVSNLFGVFCIIFAPFHSFHPFGVGTCLKNVNTPI